MIPWSLFIYIYPNFFFHEIFLYWLLSYPFGSVNFMFTFVYLYLDLLNWNYLFTITFVYSFPFSFTSLQGHSFLFHRFNICLLLHHPIKPISIYLLLSVSSVCIRICLLITFIQLFVFIHLSGSLCYWVRTYFVCVSVYLYKHTHTHTHKYKRIHIYETGRAVFICLWPFIYNDIKSCCKGFVKGKGLEKASGGKGLEKAS